MIKEITTISMSKINMRISNKIFMININIKNIIIKIHR